MKAKVRMKQTMHVDRIFELQSKITELEREKQELCEQHAKEMKTKV